VASSNTGKQTQFHYKVTGACVANIATPTERCTGAACPSTDNIDAAQAGWRFYGGSVTGITVKRSDGSTTRQTFNATGRTTSATDPLGQTTTYTYDGNNHLTQTTDPLGRNWRTTYDDQGNITATQDPLGRRVEYTYDPQWNKVTSITKYQTNGTRRVWQYQYHPVHGQIIRQTNPSGLSTYYSYTSRGELASEGFSVTTSYRQRQWQWQWQWQWQ
jgi:YD repeat-containing protein